MPRIISYAVNPPYITVYKKGYVAWSNEYIFPGWEERKDFKWGNGYVFRLEKFKPEYAYNDHTYFVHSVTQMDYTEGFRSAFDWEETMAFKERRAKYKKEMSK